MTTADHPEIQTIADMKGARAVFNSQANFINYQLPLAAIANAGFNPDRFFFKQHFTNDKPQEVLRLLLERKADIGVFRVCEYADCQMAAAQAVLPANGACFGGQSVVPALDGTLSRVDSGTHHRQHGASADQTHGGNDSCHAD